MCGTSHRAAGAAAGTGSGGHGGAAGARGGGTRACRVHEGRGRGVLRRGEDPRDRTLLDDPAPGHHGHAVGPPGHQPEVVGDDEQPGAGLLSPAQLLHDRDGHPGVQGRRRFVRDDERGGADGRGGDERALPHPARKRAGQPTVRRDRGVESDARECGPHRIDPFGGRHRRVEPERVRDLASDRPERVEGAEGLLSDVPDRRSAELPPAAVPQRPCVGSGDVEAIGRHHRPVRGQAEQRAGGDGLAGAGGPDQGDALARIDGQGNVGDDADAVDGHGEPLDGQDLSRLEGGAHRASPRRRTARPSTVTAVARATIASPGKVLIQGAVCR